MRRLLFHAAITMACFLIALGLIVNNALAQEWDWYEPKLPLQAEDDPLSYGYIIRDASGREIYRVGNDFFTGDIWITRCLDGQPVETCTDDIIKESEL